MTLNDLALRLDHFDWLAVVGRFDPLTLVQAQRIAELAKCGRSILAVVEPHSESLLPVDARAALVAALRSVQLVVISEASALPKYPQIQIVEDEAGERERSEQFLAFIVERQSAR